MKNNVVQFPAPRQLAARRLTARVRAEKNIFVLAKGKWVAVRHYREVK